MPASDWMPGKHAGAVALVTGSTRGIGEATARHLAREGARVVVTGRSKDRGESVAAAIRDDGGEATYAPADLAIEDEVAAVIAHAVERFGTITTLVNNAVPADRLGYLTGSEMITTVTQHILEQVMATGVNGVVYMCKHAMPVMAEAGGGAIVNIGSAVSMMGYRGLIAYTAMKGAVDSITRAIAVEGAPSNIRCNALILGSVPSGEATAHHDTDPEFRAALEAAHLTRVGRPQDVAYAVSFLTSYESEFLTGALVPLDGGMTCRAPAPEAPRAAAQDA
jgi:NAD(P)-dependent dehydrogenase (short-subunit alcohol dehydrogenase family)